MGVCFLLLYEVHNKLIQIGDKYHILFIEYEYIMHSELRI